MKHICSTCDHQNDNRHCVCEKSVFFGKEVAWNNTCPLWGNYDHEFWKDDTQASWAVRKDYQEQNRKPPLGLIPEWLWKKKRLIEVESAIGRYTRAGVEVPPEWVVEKEVLTREVIGGTKNES